MHFRVKISTYNPLSLSKMRRFLFFLFCFLSQLATALPKGFIYLQDIAPTIIEDLRYTTSNNFIGRPIVGYRANRCILTREAAKHLLKVQEAANQKGYSLKIYDCYRPQRAVNSFYHWSLNPKDSLMKASFYPREDKKDLFAKGYIALASGHSRGSTVDLSLIKIGSKAFSAKPSGTPCYGKTPAYQDDNSIDTGSRFDCMDKSANTDYQALTETQKSNRLLLRHLMLANGFMPYEPEWWHFTLRDEPFPKTYFNFVVQ